MYASSLVINHKLIILCLYLKKVQCTDVATSALPCGQAVEVYLVCLCLRGGARGGEK